MKTRYKFLPILVILAPVVLFVVLAPTTVTAPVAKATTREVTPIASTQTCRPIGWMNANYRQMMHDDDNVLHILKGSAQKRNAAWHQDFENRVGNRVIDIQHYYDEARQHGLMPDEVMTFATIDITTPKKEQATRDALTNEIISFVPSI